MEYTLTIKCNSENELKDIMTAIERRRFVEPEKISTPFNDKIKVVCPICGHMHECITRTKFYFCSNCGQKITLMGR